MSRSLGPRQLISHSIPLESKLSRKDSFFEKIRVFDYLEQITVGSLDIPRVITEADIETPILFEKSAVEGPIKPKPVEPPPKPSVSASTSNQNYRPALENKDVVEALMRLRSVPTKVKPKVSSQPENRAGTKPRDEDPAFKRETKRTISYRIKNSRSFVNSWTTSPILTPNDDNDSD